MTAYHGYTCASYQNVLKKNAPLKNIYSEKDRCFIVGNGPSLAKQDLSPLANEHVFVVNWFYKHKQFREILPEYYTFTSPYAFTDFKYGVYSEFAKWWRELSDALNETRGRTKLFLPLNQIDFCVRNHLFENADVHFLLTSLPMDKYGIRKVNLCGCIPSGASTVGINMLIAYYMGFRNMILIGCDCSWAALRSEDAHFYPEKIHPPSKYEQVLRDAMDQFAGYRILRNFLVPRGCKVHDATEGGFLDVFPKVKYEELFPSSMKR